MRNPYTIGRIGILLAIAGAVNWLLVGIFQWNFVSWVFAASGSQPSSVGERIVYIVVGFGGLVAIPMLAPTLARSRGRTEERDSADRDRDRAERERERAARERAAGAVVSLDAARQARIPEPTPMRAQESPQERVVLHTEERIVMPMEDVSMSSTGQPVAAVDDRLRYGTVEETDEGLGDIEDAGVEKWRAA
jgi:uncharacterized protein